MFKPFFVLFYTCHASTYTSLASLGEMTMRGAQLACARKGLPVAVIKSVFDNAAARSACRSTTYACWIGAVSFAPSLSSTPDFRFLSDNSSVTYTNWDTSHLSVFAGAKGIFMLGRTGTWNTGDPSATRTVICGGPTPPGWKAPTITFSGVTTSRRYVLVQSARTNRTHAKRLCKDRGMTLPVIKSLAENQAAQAACPNDSRTAYGRCWLDVVNVRGRGRIINPRLVKWKWASDNSTLDSFSNWDWVIPFISPILDSYEYGATILNTDGTWDNESPFEQAAVLCSSPSGGSIFFGGASGTAVTGTYSVALGWAIAVPIVVCCILVGATRKTRNVQGGSEQ